MYYQSHTARTLQYATALNQVSHRSERIFIAIRCTVVG